MHDLIVIFTLTGISCCFKKIDLINLIIYRRNNPFCSDILLDNMLEQAGWATKHTVKSSSVSLLP